MYRFPPQNEEVFILPEHFTDKSVLLKFMIDVGKRYVSRWMKSTADTEIYPHLYRKSKEGDAAFDDDFSVPELNSDTFQSVVYNESQVRGRELVVFLDMEGFWWMCVR